MPEIRTCPACRSSYIGFACPRCAAAVEPKESAAPDLSAGRSFHGYEIVEPLGRGGMSVVYKARQTASDRWVALKVLLPDKAAFARLQQRFEREGKAMASLSHPHIVSVYECGREGDHFFIAMELVEGTDLRKKIKAERELSLPEALRIVEQICLGLECAHAKGIIHRDIKPENILLDPSGNVKIADFGFAKLSDPEMKGVTLTASGVGVGTAGYMAPEQYEGAHTVDLRADIFAVGVVLFEMLNGDIPLDADDRTSVNREVDEAILKATARNPAKRFASVAELRAALSPSPGGHRRASRSTPAAIRRSWVVGLAVFLFLLLLALLLLRFA